MLTDLNSEERMLLLEFVCAFAWADLSVKPEEWNYVTDVMNRLDLPEADRERVRGWLRSPPPIDDVDPNRVPLEHRDVFIRAVEGMVLADEELSEDEREQLVLFKRILDPR